MINVDNNLIQEFKNIYKTYIDDIIQTNIYANIDDLIEMKLKAGLGFIKLYLQNKLNWNSVIDNEITIYVKDMLFRYVLASLLEIYGKTKEAERIFESLLKDIRNLKNFASYQNYIFDIRRLTF